MPDDQSFRYTPFPKTLEGPGAKLASHTRALTDLIQKETNLLKNHQTQEAKALHGQKARLMAEYQETINHLRVNTHLLGDEKSEQRVFIKNLTDDLRRVLRDHARVVLRLKSVAEGLVKSVGDEVAKKERHVAAYTPNASFVTPKAPRPTSLSLNQVI